VLQPTNCGLMAFEWISKLSKVQVSESYSLIETQTYCIYKLYTFENVCRVLWLNVTKSEQFDQLISTRKLIPIKTHCQPLLFLPAHHQVFILTRLIYHNHKFRKETAKVMPASTEKVSALFN